MDTLSLLSEHAVPRPRPGEILRGANISPCGAYRWTLTRTWGNGERVCWVMLNPSTADHRRDDPTLRRIIHFTRSWGFGGLTVVNLYPYRSSRPTECRRWAECDRIASGRHVRDALRKNTAIIAREAKRAAVVIAAWGASAWDPAWVRNMVEELIGGKRVCRDLFRLGVTESGAPKHPMARGKHRVPDDQQPEAWVRSAGSPR